MKLVARSCMLAKPSTSSSTRRRKYQCSRREQEMRKRGIAISRKLMTRFVGTSCRFVHRQWPVLRKISHSASFTQMSGRGAKSSALLMLRCSSTGGYEARFVWFAPPTVVGKKPDSYMVRRPGTKHLRSGSLLGCVFGWQ